VPTAKEAGLEGYEVSTWYALWAPKGTPAGDRRPDARRGAEVAQDADDRGPGRRAARRSPTLTGEDFGKFVTAEVVRWGKVVKEAQVKLGMP
jgi:tripartite-type tricarboxylate transporter receptor subunit TctC